MSTVLVLNSGSSSLKYQLLNPASGEVLAVGLVERIGLPTGNLTHEVGDQEIERELPIPDHGEALRLVLAVMDEVGPSLAEAGIVAVGHRVVQGGELFDGPTLVTDEVIETIRSLIPLAPLHNPANLEGIIDAKRLLPDVPHVVVFDTAFFQQLPEEAYTYAIDQEVARKYSVRRYGAHGTSHQYVSAKVAELLGRDDLKQVVLHIGNGASASAVVAGRPVETSMGLTPLEGLVMGTRTGDIDPAVVFHLSRVGGYSIDEIDNLLNKKSGLLGLAGKSDMREVRSASDDGDEAAQHALAVYRHRLVKYVGAYAAVMGGIDVLTFTAGVGENSFPLRQEVVDRLAFLGLAVDPEKNAVRSKEPRIISPDGHTGPLVMVVPTNEELAIARQSVAAIS